MNAEPLCPQGVYLHRPGAAGRVEGVGRQVFEVGVQHDLQVVGAVFAVVNELFDPARRGGVAGGEAGQRGRGEGADGNRAIVDRLIEDQDTRISPRRGVSSEIRAGCLEDQPVAGRGWSAGHKEVDVPIGPVRCGRADHHVVVAGQGVNVDRGHVDVEDLRPVVDRDGEVPHAVGGRVVAVVAGDDGDVVVAVGAEDDQRPAAAVYGELLDVVEAHPLVAAHQEPAFVVLGSRLEADRIAPGDDVQQIARRDADGIAAVDEDRNRARGNVEDVVAEQAIDR